MVHQSPIHGRSEQEKLSKLYEISALINSEIGLGKVLDRVLHAAAEIVGAQACSILMADASGENLTFLACIGMTAHQMKQFVIPVDNGIAGWAFKHGEIVCVDDTQKDPRFFSRVARELEEQHKSIVAIPLKVKGKVVGIMEAIHGSATMHFDEDDIRFLEAFANQAALAIERARLLDRVCEQNANLKSALSARFTFSDILTCDHAMKAGLETARIVAQSDTSVLILGESGTGKELLAHAIHGASNRATGPFLAINCGAIPEPLLEAELFGYEKGAFTGAVARKFGRLELADGGTVFLDEVGELPLSLQVKLLRALQERVIERLGGTEPIRIDVRIISATNRTLEDDIRARRFREDLYFRLNVVPLVIPPLRDRKNDIPLLAAHFLKIYAAQMKKDVSGFSPASLSAMRSYSWPGNVRELQNAVERAVVLSSGEYVDIMLLSKNFGSSRDGFEQVEGMNLRDAQQHFKREYVLKILDRTAGNQSQGAELMGVHRTYLSKLMKELGIESR